MFETRLKFGLWFLQNGLRISTSWETFRNYRSETRLNLENRQYFLH